MGIPRVLILWLIIELYFGRRPPGTTPLHHPYTHASWRGQTRTVPQVLLTEVSLQVCPQPTSRGDNLIRDMGTGLGLRLYRPLALRPCDHDDPAAPPRTEPTDLRASSGSSSFAPPPPPPPLPPLHAAVSIPQLTACISEPEYRLLLGVLSGNFAEPAPNDPRVLEIHQLLQSTQPAPAQPQQQHQEGSGQDGPEGSLDPQLSALSSFSSSSLPSASTPRAGDTAPPSSTLGSPRKAGAAAAGGAAQGKQQRSGSATGGPGHRGGSGVRPELDFRRSLRNVVAALGDRCTVEATVELGCAQLTLLTEAVDGTGAQVSGAHKRNCPSRLTAPCWHARHSEHGIPMTSLAAA